MGPPQGVRPTSDRVREALFARLGDITGARVLDLFGGTGALSIEAISRGAAGAVLVDCSNRSLSVMRQNVAALGLEDRAEVVCGDALRVVRRLAGGACFDLVFLDPPYESDLLALVLDALVEGKLLAPSATVVVESPKRHTLAPARGLGVASQRDYGETRITWLSPEDPPAGARK